MINILFVGDLHLQVSSPVNRTDNLIETTTKKFDEIYSLVVEHDVDFILIPGDIFNGGQVSNTTLVFAKELLSRSPVDIFVTPGNHDLFNYNINTLERSSLRVLADLVPQLNIKLSSTTPLIHQDNKGNSVYITFQEFTNELDKDNSTGYSSELVQDSSINIRVIHSMLLDHKPPFDQYTLINDVKTNNDIVVSGHDHTGFGIIQRADKKYFMNPGSLLRLAASKNEINRQVQVGLITVKYKSASLKLIPLKSAKKGSEVLNRESIEENNERAYAMEEFSTLLQKDGVNYKVDILTVLSEIAKVEAVETSLLEQVKEKVLKFMTKGDKK